MPAGFGSNTIRLAREGVAGGSARKLTLVSGSTASRSRQWGTPPPHPSFHGGDCSAYRLIAGHSGEGAVANLYQYVDRSVEGILDLAIGVP